MKPTYFIWIGMLRFYQANRAENEGCGNENP